MTENIAFSAWLKQNGLNYHNKNDRAALIEMAANSDLMRTVLTESSSRSYQQIWQEHKGRFPHLRKPKPTPRKRKINPGPGKGRFANSSKTKPTPRKRRMNPQGQGRFAHLSKPKPTPRKRRMNKLADLIAAFDRIGELLEQVRQ